MSSAGIILSDILNRVLGDPQEQARERQLMLNVTLPPLIDQAMQGSPVTETPEFEQAMEAMGGRNLAKTLRTISAENRGAYEFARGLRDTIQQYIGKPFVPFGQEIPMTVGVGGELTPEQPIARKPTAQEQTMRALEVAPLIELAFEPSNVAEIATRYAQMQTQTAKQNFGPDFNRIAYEALGPPGPEGYTPEEVGLVNKLLELRLVGRAVAQERAIQDIQFEPAPGDVGQTRAEAVARLRGRGRLATSEQAVGEQAAAVGVTDAFQQLAALGRELAPRRPTVVSRGLRYMEHAAGRVAGEPTITIYEQLKRNLGTILTRLGGETGALSRADIENFINSIPAPDLPLPTQVKLMQASYRTLYVTAMEKARARGIALDLPPPESVPEWYGTAIDPEGNVVIIKR